MSIILGWRKVKIILIEQQMLTDVNYTVTMLEVDCFLKYSVHSEVIIYYYNSLIISSTKYVKL